MNLTEEQSLPAACHDDSLPSLCSPNKRSSKESAQQQHLRISRSPDVPPKLPTKAKSQQNFKASPRRHCCYISSDQPLNEDDHGDGPAAVGSSPRTPLSRGVQRNISDISMESSLLFSPSDNGESETYDDTSTEDFEIYDNPTDEDFEIPVIDDTRRGRSSLLNMGPSSRLPQGKSPLHRSSRSLEDFDPEGDFDIPLQAIVDTKYTHDDDDGQDNSKRAGTEKIDRRRQLRRSSKQDRSQFQRSCRSLDSLPVPPTRKESFKGPPESSGEFRSRSCPGLSPMDCCETNSLSDISPTVPSRKHIR